MNNLSLFKKLQQQLQLEQPIIDNAGEYLPSAVIVPLVEEQGELSVLFEVRAQTLNRQPGEICFPGGRIELGESPQAAAVRETTEELAVRQEDVQVLGSLPVIVSPIGVVLFPYVGIVSGKVQPNKQEVAKCFTVPLNYLLTTEPIVGHMELATRPLLDIPPDILPENYSSNWKSRASYPIWFYRYEEYVIWGLTGRVLYTFLEVCRRL